MESLWSQPSGMNKGAALRIIEDGSRECVWCSAEGDGEDVGRSGKGVAGGGRGDTSEQSGGLQGQMKCHVLAVEDLLATAPYLAAAYSPLPP